MMPRMEAEIPLPIQVMVKIIKSNPKNKKRNSRKNLGRGLISEFSYINEMRMTWKLLKLLCCSAA